MSVQMCMPMGHQLVHSIYFEAFRMSRVSDDYQPGNVAATYSQQWRVGYPSLFAWSLGVIPFKDNFWSNTEHQSGCPYYRSSCLELNAELQALVATLTSGVVAFSDKIGYANVTRLMRTCRSDGVILTADNPAVILDSVFREIPSKMKVKQELVELTASFTAIGSHRWYFLLAANISDPIDVLWNDIDGVDEYYSVYDWYGSQFIGQISPKSPLHFKPFSKPGLVIPFTYYVLVPPPFHSGWRLLGESGKFVTVSKNRITSIQDNHKVTNIQLQGGPSEKVRMLLLKDTQKIIDVSCTLNNGGVAHLRCDISGCSCQ